LLTKKFLAAGLVVAGLLAFAGTCTIQNVSLTKIGSHDVFAGELHNDSGANFLGHKIVVAFLDSSGAVVDTKTVTPCLRTLQNGEADFFSVASSASSSSTSVGLARLALDSTLKVGDAETGDGTISNVVIQREDGDTVLHISGTFKNTDSTKLTEPTVCAVVYSSDNKVVLVGKDESLNDLAHNASDTFSMDLTVIDDSDIIDHVDFYVDGFKDDVPIAPISDLNNSVCLCTPTRTPTTPTVTQTPTPTATATATATATP